MLNRLKIEDVDGSYTNVKSYIENKIPHIHVLKLPHSHPLREQGKYVSLDNRRLFCFYMAFLFDLRIPFTIKHLRQNIFSNFCEIREFLKKSFVVDI